MTTFMITLLKKQNRLLLIFATLFFFAAGFSALHGEKPVPFTERTREPDAKTSENISSVVLLNNLQSSALPLTSATLHEVKNPRGIALYIPQVHQNPGSQAADRVNDDAALAQTEIASILRYLTDLEGVRLVMAEGDVYGPVSAKTLDDLRQRREAREELVQETGKLEALLSRHASPVDEAEARHLLLRLKEAIADADRELLLHGAPYLLKAEGSRFMLYGAETAETFAKSAELVRNNIFLADRLAEVGGNRPLAALGRSTQNFQIRPPTRDGREASLAEELESFRREAAAGGADDVAVLCDTIRETLQKLTAPLPQRGGAGEPPLRSANPYREIQNASLLRLLLAKSNREIESTVVDQRNRDTAENFARALEAEHETVGIVAFGAGHESGLVPALMEQGLSVIVVTPQAVAHPPAPNRPPSNPGPTNALLLKLLRQSNETADSE